MYSKTFHWRLVPLYLQGEVSLMKPLHFLPGGSQAKIFLSQRSEMLASINSRVAETSLGSSLTLACLEKMLSFTTSLSTSFFDTKYNFCSSSPQVHPCISHWNPNLESCGHMARTRLTSSLTLDTRDDVLIPAQARIL